MQPQKMSAWWPRWWWWLPGLLWGGAGGYVVVSSVSWPLPEAAAGELHSSSTEEALPALLEEPGGLWEQSFPASAYREDAGPAARRPRQGVAPTAMFSYRRHGRAAAAARFLARHNAWGFVAAHGKVRGRGGRPPGLGSGGSPGPALRCPPSSGAWPRAARGAPPQPGLGQVGEVRTC